MVDIQKIPAGAGVDEIIYYFNRFAEEYSRLQGGGLVKRLLWSGDIHGLGQGAVISAPGHRMYSLFEVVIVPNTADHEGNGDIAAGRRYGIICARASSPGGRDVIAGSLVRKRDESGVHIFAVELSEASPSALMVEKNALCFMSDGAAPSTEYINTAVTELYGII